jgi:hypothetical protein
MTSPKQGVTDMTHIQIYNQLVKRGLIFKVASFFECEPTRKAIVSALGKPDHADFTIARFEYSLSLQGHHALPRPTGRTHNRLTEWLKSSGVLLKDSHRWRTIEPPIHGEINGIPTSRGTLVAASLDGLCYIQQPTGLFLGHIDWFIADHVDETEEVKSELNLKPKQTKAERLAADLTF